MSNQSNDVLLEQAREVAEYFEGTQIDSRIHLLIDSKDYDELYMLVRNATDEMNFLEQEPAECQHEHTEYDSGQQGVGYYEQSWPPFTFCLDCNQVIEEYDDEN